MIVILSSSLSFFPSLTPFSSLPSSLLFFLLFFPSQKSRERKKERKKLLQFGVIHTNVLHACRKEERERKGRKRRHRTVVERVFYLQSFDEFLKRNSTGKKPRKQDVESVSSARKRTRTARFNEPTKKRASNHGSAEYEYE